MNRYIHFCGAALRCKARIFFGLIRQKEEEKALKAEHKIYETVLKLRETATSGKNPISQ